MPPTTSFTTAKEQIDTDKVLSLVREAALAEGFADAGITNTELSEDLAWLDDWLANDYHGSMRWMAEHRDLRANPDQLQPGTITVIALRMDYLQDEPAKMHAALDDGERAYVSRYALGRDYHKLIRKRLKKVAEALAAEIGDFGYRVFCDSAPVLEKALARNAGLGWIGKHSLVLNRQAGSWFFLGEIYTDLPLAATTNPPSEHCGSCSACIDICPTQAIIAPGKVDARRCISYLTIEHRGSIPEDLRPGIGNRIFGCDDCQLVCPWNRHATQSQEAAFAARHGLDSATLLELFAWTEAEWEEKTQGMALRRAGYNGWLRNLAVAIGNAPPSAAAISALTSQSDHADDVVREHVLWALQQQKKAA